MKIQNIPPKSAFFSAHIREEFHNNKICTQRRGSEEKCRRRKRKRRKKELLHFLFVRFLYRRITTPLLPTRRDSREKKKRKDNVSKGRTRALLSLLLCAISSLSSERARTAVAPKKFHLNTVLSPGILSLSL